MRGGATHSVLLFAKRSQSNLHSLADKRVCRLALFDYREYREYHRIKCCTKFAPKSHQHSTPIQLNKLELAYFFLYNTNAPHKHPPANSREDNQPSWVFTIWLTVPARKQHAAITNRTQRILLIFIIVISFVKFKFIDWLDYTIKAAKSKYSLRTLPLARRYDAPCFATRKTFAEQSALAR